MLLLTPKQPPLRPGIDLRCCSCADPAWAEAARPPVPIEQERGWTLWSDRTSTAATAATLPGGCWFAVTYDEGLATLHYGIAPHGRSRRAAGAFIFGGR